VISGNIKLLAVRSVGRERNENCKNIFLQFSKIFKFFKREMRNQMPFTVLIVKIVKMTIENCNESLPNGP